MVSIVPLLISCVTGLIFVLIAKKIIARWRLRNIFLSEPLNINNIVGGTTGFVKGTVKAKDTVTELFDEYTDPVINIWHVKSGVGDDRSTVASGLEINEFDVQNDNGSILVEPTYLKKEHGVDDEGQRVHRSPQDSDFIHIKDSSTTESSKDGGILKNPISGVKFEDKIHNYILENQNKTYDYKTSGKKRFYFKSLVDGEDVLVYGNVEVEQGDIKLIGNNSTPLVITDQSPDEFKKSYTRSVMILSFFNTFLMAFSIVFFLLGIELI